MRRFALVLVLPSTLILAACGSPRGDLRSPGQGVRGVVLLGPVCPVERAESPCPPRPLADTTVRVSDGGEVVATVRTDRQGRFRLPLPAGTYTVVAVLTGTGPPSSHPIRVVVPSHRFVDIRVPVDSGIRAPGAA